MVEFIKREEIIESIGMPKGAKISVFYDDEELLAHLGEKYRTSEKWCEDTLFALIYSDENAIFNIYNATQKKINYILFGPNCLSVFLNKVLWRGATPFCPTIALPTAICLQSNEENFYSAMVSLCVRRLENTMKLIIKGEQIDPKQTFNFFYNAQVADEQALLMNLFENGINSEDDVDGLVQAQTALTLLLKKEEKTLKRNESMVLLANYVIKVYNIFVEILPKVVIPTDYGNREDVLADFFNAPFYYVGIPSEYEIRKNYYLLEKNKEKLTVLCNDALCAVRYLKDRYDSFREDKGFFYGYDVEDCKLSVFISPSLLSGNTLLQTIVQSGVSDEFL